MNIYSDFKYKKDSVLVVTEEEYDKCQPSHPQFFSNNGDSLQIGPTRFVLFHQWGNWTLPERAEDDHQGVGTSNSTAIPEPEQHD